MAYNIPHLGYYGPGMDDDAVERVLRLNAMSRVYEQTDRVLTADPIQVQVVDDGPAPAWSDGQTVWINAKRIDDMDLETLTEVSGLNYHELAHLLYSPRRGTDLVKWVMNEDFIRSFNILEDQRIETLLVGRYPSVVPYLIAMDVRWLAESENEFAVNYITVRGRRYLPVEIREAFRDGFIMPELIPAIIDIVDQYRTLAFPRDYKQAEVLIERFQREVLDKLPVPPPSGSNQCTERAPSQKGRPEPGKQQERDSQAGGNTGDEESEFEPQPLLSEQQGDGEESDTNNSQGDGDGDGDEDGQAQQKQQQGQGQSSQSGTSPSSQNTDPNMDTSRKPTFGSGHIASQKPSSIPQDVQRQLSEVKQDVLSRRDVIRDSRAKQRTIVGGDGKNSELMKKGKYELTATPPEVVGASRKFAQELERLRDECEPGWEREMPSGRLNVQRVIRGCEIDNAFDRWDEGNDGADVEAVILIDRSGSMCGNRNDLLASHACWTIKRAMEHIDAPVTVYAFDDATEVAYQRDERANKTQFKYIYGNGGTDPYDSLLAAERILNSSRKKNKMLIMITDGVFNREKNDEVIDRLNKQGVLTALALIIEPRYLESYQDRSKQWRQANPTRSIKEDPNDLQHGCSVFTSVSHAKDLLPFARNVVTGAIRKRAGAR